jgi:hypothetical protein
MGKLWVLLPSIDLTSHFTCMYNSVILQIYILERYQSMQQNAVKSIKVALQIYKSLHITLRRIYTESPMLEEV